MAIEQHIIADKNLIRTARVISMIFTPFSIPFMAFLILFVFSYLRIMPLQYKLIVLGVVYCFTILMPTLTIFLFRKINGFTPEDLTERKRRYVPFILTITSYVFCLLMMHRLNIPWYMTGIIFASLYRDDYLCHCQPEMEAQRTHGGSRCHNRWAGCFQCPVRIQSGGLAVYIHSRSRRIGHGTDYPATPYAR
mgnify:CR=1 FL=1